MKDGRFSDVVNHMVGGAKIVSIELSGRGEGVNYYVNHLRGLDPVDAYRAASAEAVDVFRADPGLVDRTSPMPWGPETGATVATMFMGDHFAHAWDVAKATGQSTDLDPELAEMLMPFAREYSTRHRGPGMFDEQQVAPPGASRRRSARRGARSRGVAVSRPGRPVPRGT